MKNLSLLEVENNKECIVDGFSSSLPIEIIKRLNNFGIIKGARISLIKLSRFSKSGIVSALDTCVCLDFGVLEKIWVKQL